MTEIEEEYVFSVIAQLTAKSSSVVESGLSNLMGMLKTNEL